MKKTILYLSNQTISSTFLSTLESVDNTILSVFLHARDRKNDPVNLQFWRDLFLQQLSLVKCECNLSPKMPFWKGGSALIAGNTVVVSSIVTYDHLAKKMAYFTRTLDQFFYSTEKAVLLTLGDEQFLYQPAVMASTILD